MTDRQIYPRSGWRDRRRQRSGYLGRPWVVRYSLAYDGGGAEWTGYYRWWWSARLGAWWHYHIASWGGTVNLTKNT